MDKRLVKIIRQKAKNGNAVAQYIEGICYALGANGFILDLHLAYKYLKKSADNGHKKAMKVLENTYCIAGRNMVFLEPICNCIKVRERLFCSGTLKMQYLQENYADKIKSFQEIFPEAFELYRSYLMFFCFDVENILDYFGDDTYHNEYFQFLSQDFPSISGWDQMLKIIGSVKEKYERYEKAKQSRPSSYGNFVGGGQGIRGGISGALKASLLNFAIDAGADTVNRYSDHNKLMDIYNDMDALYKALVEKGTYLQMFKQDCLYAGAFAMDELVNKKYLYKVDLESWIDNTPVDKVEEIVKRGKSDPANKQKAIDDLLDLIQKKPYDHTLYVALCRIESQYAIDLIKLMQELNMDYFLLIRIYPNDENIKYYELPDFSL